MPTLLEPSYAVVAAACRAPWGAAAEGLPGAAPVELPNVAGFVTSRFSPLVVAVAEACLGEPGSGRDLVAGRGERTAMVLATAGGDHTTTDVATQRMVAGQVHSPLLFFQSVTTSVLGHLAKRYGITGPISCVSAGAGLAPEALRVADILLDDEELDQVLLVGVELAANERVDWVQGRLDGAYPLGPLPRGDAAVALLLRRAEAGDTTPSSVGDWPEYGWLAPLVGLCALSTNPTTP
ncbi:beta-ketoacyl-[acyl-carrier-protein] synthase family protein [Kitasatospora mediocidica]|uniref:ketosynthase n=1 Tax=Kitasatospora mediocidica TaxID=58352 RepID=UPI0005665630|nr:ketosynthase [Kitasatospora mediocidica]